MLSPLRRDDHLPVDPTHPLELPVALKSMTYCRRTRYPPHDERYICRRGGYKSAKWRSISIKRLEELQAVAALTDVESVPYRRLAPAL